MANEFEGKRYTTIIHRHETTNVITGEKKIYGDRYGVYDNEKKSEIEILNFRPTCYEDIRAKAHELNDNISVMSFEDIEALEYSWTAEVLLNNNQLESIWHTAFPSSKSSIKKVVSISSDYPAYRLIQK